MNSTKYYKSFERDGEYDCLIYVDLAPDDEDVTAKLWLVYYLGQGAQAMFGIGFADKATSTGEARAMRGLDSMDAERVDAIYREDVEPTFEADDEDGGEL